MSIAGPVGALSHHLGSLTAAGQTDRPASLFESLGMTYLGPIDGHDLDALAPELERIRDQETGPVLLHIVTQKGKGYHPAAASADKGHAVGKFDVATGQQAKSSAPKPPDLHQGVRRGLIAEAARDERVGGDHRGHAVWHRPRPVREGFPRADVRRGHRRAARVTFAAGMASEGYKPFCAIYSTFLQRAYDQIVHDVAIQNLPGALRHRPGGAGGCGRRDPRGRLRRAYLTCLPNMVVMAASDEAELVNMVATAAAHDSGPIAFRYPRGEGVGVALPERGEPLPIGKGRIVREGKDAAILCFGTRLHAALAAADHLAKHGISCTVADARFASRWTTT